MDDLSATADGLLRRIPLRGFDGASVCAYVGGNLTAPTVVLVNALGMSIDFWLPLARKLAPRFRILTWESRGVGEADGDFEVESYGVAFHVNDLLSLLEINGVDAAHVVAWCNGSQVALRFAASRPERVDHLVLLNGSFNLPEDVPRTSFEKNMRMLMPKIAHNIAYAKIYHQMAAASSTQGDNPLRGQAPALMVAADPALLNLANAAFRTPGRLYRYAHLITHAFNEPSDTLTEKLNAPVLVVAGERDEISHPESSREIARRIKGARLVTVEGDHYSLYHDERLQHVVYDFLSED